jgi:HEXXH motif-containing protein
VREHHRIPFAPDVARARRLDERMRARLGESLRHVLGRSRGILAAPPGLDAFLVRLADGPVDPQAFGAYYELVLAIEDAEHEAAEALLAEIADAPRRAPDPLVRELGDPDTCPRSRRYARLTDTDPDWPLRIVAPAPETAATSRALVADALALIRRAHPALAGEIAALIGEIVLARSAETTRGESFDGVSSFMLWGGLVLHAGSHATRLEMVEVLAHESAHTLLFGLACDGPLLENDDEERFASPLRRDPRPLDGIYHATFVTARMHHALRHLLDVGAIEAEQDAWVCARLEAHRKHFDEGLGVLERHARLTGVGTAALQAAREYMAGG